MLHTRSAIIGETIPAGRALSAEEIAALLQDCINDPRPIGARDAAVIAVTYSGGLRRAEVAKLGFTDYDKESKKLK